MPGGMERNAPGFENATWFDAIDGVTGRLLLPLSGLVTAIFIGWVADRQLVNGETGLKGGMLTAWRFLIAWLCPLAVAVILVLVIATVVGYVTKVSKPRYPDQH